MPKQSTVERIKPGISARGFLTAVKDYTEAAVVEELVANSYDADASTVLVLLDSDRNELHVLDDGRGFSKKAMRNAGILGGGEKADVEVSLSNRPYLGAYGFGLKATVKIATAVNIRTRSEEGEFEVQFDWSQLDEALKPEFEGYALTEKPIRKGLGTGAHITLRLRNPTSEDILDAYGSVLGNLPDDNGKFKCYVGTLKRVKRELSPALQDFTKLKSVARKLAQRRLLVLGDLSTQVDLQNCRIFVGSDRQDPTVKYKIFFSGIREGKVDPLKMGLRGIYVRIHGRLLKHSFTEQKFVYPISKWVKFASGLRVELTVDWLRNEISLSRDDLKFSNPKLEEQFRATITRVVSGFIQPQLKKLARKSERQAQRGQEQRLELARKRINPKGGLVIPFVKSGFNFIPESDAELGLLLSNPDVLKRVNSSYRLIDYNEKTPFDCLIYDEARRDFVFAELEPTLMEFLQHKTVPEELALVLTWSLGKWRVGARKKGKHSYFQLLSEKGSKRGHFKLLSFSREKSEKPSAAYSAIALDQVLSK